MMLYFLLECILLVLGLEFVFVIGLVRKHVVLLSCFGNDALLDFGFQSDLLKMFST